MKKNVIHHPSHNTRWLTSLIAMLAVLNVEAQNSAHLPRLVVNILVDQLRTDYMEAFVPLYGEGGFKRLMADGRYFSDAQVPFRDPDRASAAASLVTGAVPYDHGIVNTMWLSRETLQPVFCVDDVRYRGHQTFEKTSPCYLLTTTISDELELATGECSVIYSIAPEREMAVLMAGHVADGAFWLNEETGSWCGTNYYGDYPNWASAYERQYSLGKKIGRLTWEPVYDGGLHSFHYFQGAFDEKSTNFKHSFEGDGRFRSFKNSALVNEETVNFVKRCLENSYIARDYVPDLLNIGLYAGNYEHQSVLRCPSEMQDTYVRLDRALEDLMTSVETITGKGQAMFILSSTGYADSDADDINFSKYRIPSGTFSMQRASMLLNMYLTALFGQAQYIDGTRDQQFYLNRKLLEQRQLNSNEVLARCEEFLSQMAGVRDVYTSSRLTMGAWVKGLDHVRSSWNINRSGDILLEVNPGWKIVNEDNTEYVNQGEAYLSYPMFFLGGETLPARIGTPVSTAAIAPTLARCLRIRAPNGSREAPLVLK